MKNHPLFNDDPDNTERAARDIGFINIYEFQGSKRVALTNTWDPEELQTLEDVFAVTGPGNFELIGRDSINKRIVDRQMISLKAPRGMPERPAVAEEQRRPFRTEPMPSAQPAQPIMQGGGFSIPSGMDPTMAMFLMLTQSQSAQASAQLAAQREDARAANATMAQLFGTFAQSQASMVTGLAAALGGPRSAPSSGGDIGAADAFMKGVETMGQLLQGVKEGAAEAAEPKGPGLADVAKNIADSLGAVRDIARATTGMGNPVSTEPVIPTGP
jgi:hypothetical protein